MTETPTENEDALTHSKNPNEAKAEAVIKNHMVLAMAGGLIPIPLLDLAAITSVQLDMLKKLSDVYDVELDSGSARTFITSLTSAIGVTTAARFGASAMKLLPGIGTLAGGVTQIALTGGSTYAVGTLFRRLFREGKSLDALTTDMVREEFQSYYDSGVKLARELAEEGPGRIFRRRNESNE